MTPQMSGGEGFLSLDALRAGGFRLGKGVSNNYMRSFPCTRTRTQENIGEQDPRKARQEMRLF